MKAIRAVIIVIFLAAVGIYGLAEYQEMANADPNRPQLVSETERIVVPCDYTEEDIMEGLSAHDEEDGDLTGEILLGGLSRFTTPGICRATYVVFDSANQSAVLTREVEFEDYRSPRFTLSAPLVFLEGASGDAISNVGAEDVLDGDISTQVRMTANDISYLRTGEYTMTVEVSNSFGDYADAVLPVHVVTSDSQALSLDLETNLLYLEQGSAFSPDGYVTAVRLEDGSEAVGVQVTAQSDVDPSVPGCYEVEYTAEDEEGRTGVTWMIVIVEE